MVVTNSDLLVVSVFYLGRALYLSFIHLYFAKGVDFIFHQPSDFTFKLLIVQREMLQEQKEFLLY